MSSHDNMEAVSNIRHFPVIIGGQNLKEEIFPILQQLRPEWSEADLCQEDYSEGYVNMMCCFYHASDPRRKDAMVVRVYGQDGEEDHTMDKDREFLSLQLAHASGCFPAIIASFRNGLVYHYEPGRTMTFKDLNRPENIRKVMGMLYKLQDIDAGQLSLFTRDGKPAKYNTNPRTYQETLNFIASIPQEPKDKSRKEKFEKLCEENTKEYMLAEYEFIWNILQETKLPMSFSHGDMHPKNMIIDDETGKVSFIDYELAGFYYRNMDLAVLLDTGPIYRAQNIKTTENDDDGITAESRDQYIREYLHIKKSAEETGKSVAADEVELLDIELRILNTAWKFQGISIGLSYVDFDLKDIDLLDFASFCKEQYVAQRKNLLKWKDRYLQLRGK